ncbi:MAG: hypothetical protein PHZ11_06330, partial [Desulfitobacteriaceae bacterium]|nr:hypothetical protein [Desulfitobacteriaceae bacterium]
MKVSLNWLGQLVDIKESAENLAESLTCGGKAIIKFVDVWENGDAARDFPVLEKLLQGFVISQDVKDTAY